MFKDRVKVVQGMAPPAPPSSRKPDLDQGMSENP